MEKRLSSWSEFSQIIREYCSNEVSWNFRGHRNSDWKLLSSFSRLLNAADITETEELRERHLKQFEFAARGFRNPVPVSEKKPGDDPILYDWAQGQHHGLATPLLDWSLYPYVAAFFAFESSEPSPTRMRTVWALHALPVQNKTKAELKEPSERQDWKRVRELPLIRFFRPKTGENMRLIRQNGLFSITPSSLTIEDYVSKEFASHKHPVLIKIDIPETEREACLCELNRMSINHTSLFPDLSGAGAYANLAAIVKGYRL